MTCEPIFDLSVPDWEYISFLSCLIKAPHGYIDILALVYKDEDITCKLRVLFPSGNTITGIKTFGNNLDGPIEFIKNYIEDLTKPDPFFPMFFKPSGIVEIKNPGLKGRSLFDELVKHPSIEISIKEVCL